MRFSQYIVMSDDDWTAWLRRGLGHAGRTQRGLALALGVDASAVSRLLHGQRRLRAHEIPVAARYLGLDAAAGISRALAGSASSAANGTSPGSAAPGRRPSDLLPLLGLAAGSVPGVDDAVFLLNDAAPIDRVRRPDGLIASPRAFALQVVGASMAPRYEQGDVIAVDPDRRPEVGSDVVVALRAHTSRPKALSRAAASDEVTPGRCLLLKRLLRRGHRAIRLAQFNPPRDDILIPAADVHALWSVVPMRAVLGL